jgi:hypothetical protein
MEPRQLWNRNTVLAEAFCLSDEHVRSAQSALDETQAHRSRLLAAFAVTVGSDSAVADLLGLSEREVRVARRTVGKEDARRMAEDVLAGASVAGEPEAGESAVPATPPPPQPQVPPPTPAQAAQQQPQHQSQSQSQSQHPYQQQQQQWHQPQHHQPYSHQTSPLPDVQTAAVPDSPMASTAEIPVIRETAWTSAMDLVLIDSWQSGIDLRVLADEFGLDLARLVTRVQQLSAEGRLTSPQPAAGAEDRSGRHRRDMNGTSGGTSGGTYGASGSSYDTYGNSVTPSGWEAPSTIPDEMVASYLPPQHTWPQYMAGSSAR